MGRLVGVVACVAGLVTPSSVLAQSRPGTSEHAEGVETPSAAIGDVMVQARAAFQEGTLLARQARWIDALGAFERSAALHPHAITSYNIGYCERILGHWTRARKALRQALTDHQARGGVELPPDLVTAAQAFLGEADRQIARVVVTTQGGAVGVDGAPLEVSDAHAQRPLLVAGTRALGAAEIPLAPIIEVEVDPGSHVFVLVSEGKADVVASETLSPGSWTALELRMQPPQSARISTEAAMAPVQGTTGPNRLPAYIALGIGAAGLATGSVSGLLALGTKNAASSACGPTGDYGSCNAQRDAQSRAADVSTIALITGGVGFGVGAVLFFTAPGGARRKGGPGGRPEVRPWVGAQCIGVRGEF